MKLLNTGKEQIIINWKKACAQVIFVPCVMTTPIEVDELPETVRGVNGWGSSDERQAT